MSNKTGLRQLCHLVFAVHQLFFKADKRRAKVIVMENLPYVLVGIIVMEKAFNKHSKSLEEVFQGLRNDKLGLSTKGYHLLQTKVTYLCLIVNKNGAAVDLNKGKFSGTLYALRTLCSNVCQIIKLFNC